MFKWLNSYNKATAQTKYFILTLVAYGLALLLTTIYVYARIDFERSYKPEKAAETPQNNYDSSPSRILQK